MPNRLDKFLALSLEHKILFLQAWLLLGGYRAAVLLVPLKRLAGGLQHHADCPAPVSLSSQQIDQATAIGRAVAAAATATPWHSPCLTQVLVVQRLLQQRDIPGQFYLGVRKSEAQRDNMTDLTAHAWLQCGDRIVNGAKGHDAFTVVSTYSWGAP